jgi:hypothetical protein
VEHEVHQVPRELVATTAHGRVIEDAGLGVAAHDALGAERISHAGLLFVGSIPRSCCWLTCSASSLMFPLLPGAGYVRKTQPRRTRRRGGVGTTTIGPY